jgi:hypothetical protein
MDLEATIPNRDKSQTSRVHFLHVSKTGGTTLKQMLLRANITTTGDGRPLVMNGHQVTMPVALARGERNQVTCFLRHPVPRFVSGFNSRLRKGAPAHLGRWDRDEKIVFQQFRSANEAAEALSSSDLTRQNYAISSMRALTHTRWKIVDWLVSIEYLEPRLDRIAFMGFQEMFDEDVARFYSTFGLGERAELEHHHEAPDTDSTELSAIGQRNIRRWYQDDIALYEWALERRERWNPYR